MTDTDGKWHDVRAVPDVAEGELSGARVAGLKLCIGRSDGELFAVDDECPHAGGSLSEGLLDGDQVVCPLHAYGFEVRSGHCPDDPSCSIRAYAIRLEDGQIQVRLPEPQTDSQEARPHDPGQ